VASPIKDPSNKGSEKNKIKTKRSAWTQFKKRIKKLLLTDDLITLYFNQFKKEVLNNLNDNDFFLLFLKIKFHEGGFKTLGPLQKINKSDFDDILTLYKTILESKDEYYLTTPITLIVFSYITIPSDKLTSNKSKITNIKKERKVDTYKLSGYNLPATMDLSMW